VQRNSLTVDCYTIAPVEDFAVFTGFLCSPPDAEDRDLEEFLATDARQHFVDRIAVTYALTSNEAPHIPLGFATLANDAIVIGRENSLPEVAAYPYASFPAVKIGRFGIVLPLQKQGLGGLFLAMLTTMMREGNRTGCRFITVDAWRNKKAGVNVTPFYKKHGFAILPCREKTSHYIPMYFDLLPHSRPGGV
jgi:GNAT superfamily N-acetyltransferase